MPIIAAIKSLINKLNDFVQGILYRIEKRGDNVRGYALGGPRRVKRFSVFFVLFLLGTIIFAVFVKDGDLTSAEYVVNREVAPGTKRPTTINPNLSGRDVGRFGDTRGSYTSGVDCDRILRNLRIRGTLTAVEKNNFDKECRDKVGQELSELIDKISSDLIPKQIVGQILDSANQGNAGKILRALENPELIKSLATDSGSLVAARLVDFGELSENEIDQIIQSIKKAPPQFKQKVLDVGLNIAKIKNSDTRRLMLKELDGARSLDAIADIGDFVAVIEGASEEEQEILSRAFAEAKGKDAKRALLRAAKEIVQIDSTDPVREKLISFIEEAGSLPMEERALAFGKVADVAKIYRTTDDPAIRRAISENLLGTASIDEAGGLMDRIIDVAEAGKSGGLDLKTAILAIEGIDDEAVTRVQGAAAAMRNGDSRRARLFLHSDTPLEQIKRYLVENKGRNRSDGGDVSKSDLTMKMGEKRKTEAEISDIKAQIKELLRGGAAPGDPRILMLYERLINAERKIGDLDEVIADIRSRLYERLSGLKRRYGEAFADSGFVLPEFKVNLPSDDDSDSRPPPRLSNLRDVKEFWNAGRLLVGLDQELLQRKRVRSIRFGSNEDQSRSILDDTTKDLRGKLGDDGVWYSASYGPAGSGGVTVAKEFEISRLTRIPGIIKRVPSAGIPSSRAAKTKLEFQFLASVANRKTGLIEIPEGSVAICQVKSFNNGTGRLEADCNAVDTGGKDDITVNLTLADPTGTDGLSGQIVDNRGWHLAGIFLTAFSQSVLEGFSQAVVSPFEDKAEAAASDYIVLGAASGTQGILQEVASKQIQSWQNADVFWIGYDGMLATIRQK